MNKAKIIAGISAGALFLSGCAGIGGGQSQVIDVKGKVQAKSFLGVTGSDGDPCTGAGPIVLELNGQEVKLKNAEGTIVGVANLEGWKADPSRDLNPDSYGYNDGELCAWDFSFPDVSLDSNFYTLEFSDKRVSPPTITKEELANGPIVSVD